MNRRAKTLVTILISAVFLMLALWNFNLDEFAGALRHLNPWYAVPALAAYLSSFFFRTLRWRLMLRSVKPVPMWPLFTYLAIGYMANDLLPARLGEVVRAYITGKREQMSRSAAFASVILERLFDGLTIVVILVILMLGAGLDKGWLRYLAWVSALLFLGGLGFLFLLAYQKEKTLQLAEAFFRFLPRKLGDKLLYILRRFVAGLALLHEPKDLILSISLSFFVWLCEVLVYVIYLYAFQIEVPLQAAFLALVVVNLSTLIPSSPGYIGVFQFACIQSLALFGIGTTTALTWSVAIHATQIVPLTLLGLFFLSRMGLSMRDLKDVELEEGNPANEA